MVSIQSDAFERLAKVGGHERKIQRFFAGKMEFTGKAPVIDRPLVLIAFTNRCGSNYLAELMRSTGRIVGLGEGLNSDAMIKRSKDWGVTSFPDYMLKLNHGRKNPFGLKTSWDQLLMLLRWRIDRMFPKVQIIHIRRRNILEQAISRDIAWQTQKWTSQTKVTREVEPVYDGTSITRHLEAIRNDDTMLPIVFDGFQLPVTQVVYEDLVDNPDQTLRDVMEWLGIDVPGDWQVTPTRLKRQANETNRQFLETYREEVMARGLRH